MLIHNLARNLVFMVEAGEGGDAGGGATPAPAPAPAPAAPAAPAPAPAPAAPQAAAPAAKPAEPAAEDKQETFTYEPTGNPTLDYALSYFGEHGLGQEHPAIQAAAQGDFAQLEVELLRKGAPGSDKVLALAQKAYTETQEAEQAKIAETGQALVEVAGSLEQWEEVVTWARANGDESEKSEINALLQEGGLKAKIAARYLVEAYKAADGTSYEAKPAVGPGAAPAPAAQKGPISRVEFAREAEKLFRQFGEDYTQRPEYRALAQRRKG